MVPMLRLVYLFYLLMISRLFSRKRVDFTYLWCLSADFKIFWWSFTSLGKPKFESLSMSLVHFIIRLIAIMSTVCRLKVGLPVKTFGNQNAPSGRISIHCEMDWKRYTINPENSSKENRTFRLKTWLSSLAWPHF